MNVIAKLGELKPGAIRIRILERLLRVEDTLERMEQTMATIVEIALEVKDAVNARIDREIAKGQEKLVAKQAELDSLIAVEDAEDVAQAAQIAALQAEVAGQTEAVAVLESIKTGVNADLEQAPVEPAPVEEAPVEVPVEAPVEEAPVDQAPEESAVIA